MNVRPLDFSRREEGLQERLARKQHRRTWQRWKAVTFGLRYGSTNGAGVSAYFLENKQ